MGVLVDLPGSIQQEADRGDRSDMRSLRGVALASLLASPVAANAQSVDDNAVAAADDAFGQSVGNERVGIYTTDEVRGFSPVDAGNARIEGLYFAPLAALPQRLVQGSRVRVGLTAQGYPFPAPTGIVDYDLNASETSRQLTLSVERGQFGSLVLYTDARLDPAADVTAYAGGTIRAQNRHEGGDFRSHILTAGLQWRPARGASLTGFFGLTRTYDDEAAPSIFPGGDYLPPEIERRRSIGQSWSDRDNTLRVAGAVLKLPHGPWLIEAGLFGTEREVAYNFTDLFSGMRPDGTTANRVMVIDPDNLDRMASGEARVARVLGDVRLGHRVTLSLRGKRGNRVFGGAQRVSLGESSLLFADERPKPDFAFGPDDRDRVSLVTGGIGYALTRPGRFSIDLALSLSRYRKTIELASVGAPAVTRETPITGSATANVNLLPGLTIYGGFVRGFEEVTVAPANASNRGEAPPAIETDQADLGVRYALAPDLSTVVGLFSITKPYFNVDDSAIYRELGSSRNRGIEFSLSGGLAPGLTLILGTVLLDATITGELVDAGVIGARPVGSVRRRSSLNLDWRLDGGTSPWSLDLAVESYSERVGNTANRLLVPRREVVDLGFRYRFELAATRALLRLQVANIFDDYSWQVSSNGAFQYTHNRRLLAELRFDLPT